MAGKLGHISYTHEGYMAEHFRMTGQKEKYF